MKWSKCIACGMIIAALVAGGCSAETSEYGMNDSSAERLKMTTEAAAENGTTKPSDDSMRQQSDSVVTVLSEESVKDAQNSMILGKIVTIYGNYIQINIAELPEKMTQRANGTGNLTSEGASESEQANLALSMGTGRMPPSGNQVPREGAKNGRSSSDLVFSGEILDVMIPVGSRIYSSNNDNLELTYDSLRKGMVLRIQVDMEMTEAFQAQTEAETYYADNVMVVE